MSKGVLTSTLASIVLSGATLLGTELPDPDKYSFEISTISKLSIAYDTVLASVFFSSLMTGSRKRRGPRDPRPPVHDTRLVSNDSPLTDYNHLPGIHDSRELYKIS